MEEEDVDGEALDVDGEAMAASDSSGNFVRVYVCASVADPSPPPRPPLSSTRTLSLCLACTLPDPLSDFRFRWLLRSLCRFRSFRTFLPFRAFHTITLLPVAFQTTRATAPGGSASMTTTTPRQARARSRRRRRRRKSERRRKRCDRQVRAQEHGHSAATAHPRQSRHGTATAQPRHVRRNVHSCVQLLLWCYCCSILRNP